jgi:predicted Zn finger-like uncharacterized protein
MRVSCPNCQTEYDVPDAALAGRQRKLRCAQCSTQFMAGPLAEPGDFTQAPPAPSSQFVPAPPAAPMSAAPMPAAPPFTPPPLAQDDWPRPADTPDDRQAASAPDDVRILAEAPTQKPYIPPQLRPVEIDPQEARQIADRESFAALLESSRQAGAQEPEEIIPTRGCRIFGPWQISIIVLLLLIGLIFIERSLIMQLWPPSIRLFEALGLAK